MSAKLEAALPSLYFLNPIIFYGRGLPLLSGSGMRYTPFRNESARIEPLGQESCQRAYRCATRFGGSPKKPPAFMWRSLHFPISCLCFTWYLQYCKFSSRLKVLPAYFVPAKATRLVSITYE